MREGLEVGDSALLTMMLDAHIHEAAHGPAGGPRFFSQGTPVPVGAEADLLLPSFRAFMTAKSAAIGDRLSVALGGPQESGRCGLPMDASRTSLRLDEAMAAAVPDMAEYPRRLYETASRDPGAFELERRYVVLNSRTREDGRCITRPAVLAIEDGLHEGAGNGGQPVELQVELASVSMFGGRGDAALDGGAPARP